jgi:hypothetical protein
MMTRKDYELLALHLNKARQSARASTLTSDHDTAAIKTRGVVEAISAVANALASDNPRFNRDKFLKACGVE